MGLWSSRAALALLKASIEGTSAGFFFKGGLSTRALEVQHNLKCALAYFCSHFILAAECILFLNISPPFLRQSSRGSTLLLPTKQCWWQLTVLWYFCIFYLIFVLFFKAKMKTGKTSLKTTRTPISTTVAWLEPWFLEIVLCDLVLRVNPADLLN